MTDGIKFYFPAGQFSGNFENCALQEVKDTRKEWRLYNPQNRSHMSVWEHKNGAVTIKGSLRKWFFGKNSVNDLALKNVIEATKQVAERLGISWETLCSAKITQVEIGFNIPISIPFGVLINKIVSYATHKESEVRGKGRTKGNYGTLYFGVRDREVRLKIYNKRKEIEDKRDITDDTPAPKSNGKDIARIEFTFDDKDAFKRKGLPSIASINDLVQNWKSLYELWAEEVGRITILSNISDYDELDRDDILCAEALTLYPWKENIKAFDEYIEEKYKTEASKNNAKSKYRRRINNLLDDHSNPDEYGKFDFYKDIIAYIAELKRVGEDISLPLMIARLTSHTHFIGVE